ncbi:MAG: beta-mannosidase [Clostridiales bacterium]|nr:beta-mannosidase [Clostridiales bacterium]
MEESRYAVSPAPINPRADDCARRLKKFLADIYGRQTLAGQQASGLYSYENAALKKLTGRMPAISGFDFMDYSPGRVERGAGSRDAEDAILWWDKGGIVTFCWHWNAPKDLVDSKDQPWYRGFYTDATSFDISRAMDGRDPEGYRLILRDIDAIAAQLRILADAGVPVIWRPLHEASGGWFWWGAKGAKPCVALYRLLYDRLTRHHRLNNLLWAWSGQSPEWYPGDEYVDLIGEDIYPPEHEHTAQKARFEQAANTPNEPKLIAMTENGAVPDIDAMYAEGARWLYFCTWGGDFVFDRAERAYSEKTTSAERMIYTFQHPDVVTLDELPDLKTYPLP